MLAANEGLTKTYNRFHDPDDQSSGIVRLRELHVQMDLTVRDAYGWTDLDLEHGWQKTVTMVEKKDKKTGVTREVEKVEWRYTVSERARREILKRLLDLNHRRHAEEVARGETGGKKGKRQPAALRPSPTKASGARAAGSEPGLLFLEPQSPAPQVSPQLGLLDAVPTAAPRMNLNDAAERIRTWLREHPGRYARADLLAATRVPEELWADAIRMLESRREVIRTGEKRGTRYEARRVEADYGRRR